MRLRQKSKIIASVRLVQASTIGSGTVPACLATSGHSVVPASLSGQAPVRGFGYIGMTTRDKRGRRAGQPAGQEQRGLPAAAPWAAANDSVAYLLLL